MRLTTLPSGLSVVSHRLDHVKTVSVAITAGVGGRDEAADEHGVSHLLEHMAFKGTGRRTARAIAEEIETVGGDLNAATSAETTTYYAKTLEADLPLAFDILADILADPRFDASELAKEQNVIVQEIGAATDAPDDLIFDHFLAIAFPDQPLGRSILGTPETVRAATPAGLLAYLERHYTAPRMVVSAAGAVDHEALVALAAETLDGFAGEAPPSVTPGSYGGGVHLTGKPLEQTNILFGFPGVSYRDPDVYALGVFANVLGGGLSSRLFQEIREERGLCYSIYAFHWAYSDVGVFGVSAGCDPKDAPDLTALALDALARAAGDCAETEIARARAQMKVGLLGALESPGARADQIARQVLAFGRPIDLDEISARIDAVDVGAVRRAARAVLDAPISFAALGPKRGLDKSAKLAAQFRP